MTREEVIYCMKSYIDNPNYEHCTSCPYYGANQIDENVFVCNSGEAHKMAVEALEQEPIEEMVHVETLKQVMWERDIAIKQLNELGYGFGQKIDPCTDAISRQAAIDAFNAFADEVNQDTDIHEAIEIVLNLPPVTPTEKMGHWIARGLVDSNGNRIYECSECHHSDTQAATMIVPYCWYCGAKMQGVKE